MSLPPTWYKRPAASKTEKIIKGLRAQPWLWVFFLFLSSQPVFSQASPSTQRLFQSLLEKRAAPIMARGRVAVTDDQTLAALQSNPALLGTLEGAKTEFNTNSVQGRFWIYQNVWAVPTLYGNVAFGYSMWDRDDNLLKLEETFDAFFAYSLRISRGIQLGAGYLQDPLRKSAFLGAHIPFFTRIRIWRWFGFWDLNYGASVQNLTIENTYGIDSLEPFTYQGFDFILFKSQYAIVRPALETGFRWDFIQRDFRAGIDFIFLDRLILALGGWGNELMTIKNLTWGFGIQEQASHLSLKAMYSRETRQGNLNSSFHFQADFRIYGESTRLLRSEVINETFSPRNSDGIKDVCIFTFEQIDKILPRSWSLFILDDNGVVKKTFTSKDKRYEGRQKFIPKEIAWNGRDDYNNYVPDGEYQVRFQYMDKRNSPYFIRAQDIVVDNTPPSARVYIEQPVIKIATTGEYKPLRILFSEYDGEFDDIWQFSIKDVSGRQVKAWTMRGTEIGDDVKWDGFDEYGVQQSTGLYDLSIVSADSAGNRSTPLFFRIQIQYQEYGVTLQPEYRAFSPNNDKVQDDVVLNTLLEKTDEISHWSMRIRDSRNRTVHSQRRFRKPPPVYFRWPGISRDNIRLPDGIYYPELIVHYRNKRVAKSFLEEVEIDTKPPESSLAFSPAIFSPDGDGVDEVVLFEIGAKDNSGIAGWRLDIFEPGKKPFRTYKDIGPPPEVLKWDGTGDNGQLVSSFSIYNAVLTVRDRAGNSSRASVKNIEVDFLIFRLGNELRVKNFGIQFSSSRTTVYPELQRKLDKIGKIMKNRLKNFNVRVEGYSDILGDEDWAVKVSKKRAYVVARYLKNTYNFEKGRITAVGRGKERPISLVKTPQEQAVNRRVEFLFTKKIEKEKDE